jgi:hypothetical protein
MIININMYTQVQKLIFNLPEEVMDTAFEISHDEPVSIPTKARPSLSSSYSSSSVKLETSRHCHPSNDGEGN